MPATFSRRYLGCLLLLLFCTRVSGESPTGASGSKGDPAMTTQDANQTEVNSVTKMKTGHESPGPNVATDKLKPASKENTHNLSEHEILLSGVAGAPVEKNISVPSRTKVELTCKLDENSNLKNLKMTWKKGSEAVDYTCKNPNCWTIQLTISDSSDLGTYTCILKGEIEVSAVFHLQVPKIEGKEKPIITYEGDRAVMVCKTEYSPKDWIWYMTNGTELVPIDKILHTDKFIIKRQSAEVNRLEILKLTKEDGGVFCCEAAFDLGTSRARFELRVLSITTPLKPFIAIVAEVAILVTTIVLFEVYSKRKGKGSENQFEQMEKLKSEDVPRRRK